MVGKQLIEEVIKQIGTKVKTDFVRKETNKSLINISDIEQISTNTQNILLRALITETASQIVLSIDSDFKLSAILKDKNGNIIYTSNVIDLPLETMVVGASYDDTTKEIVLTLQNGNTLRFSVADLVSGLVSTTSLQTALANYYNKTETDNLLDDKVDKVAGKGLSTNDFTDEYKNQVDDNTSNISDIQEEQTTQNNNITALQEENTRLRSDIEGIGLTGAEEGTSIDLSDSAEARFSHKDSNGLEVCGNSTQETTTGKNLFDKNGDFTYGSNYYETSLNNKGQIVSTSNYRVHRSAGILINNFSSNTNYVISGKLISATGSNSTNIANIEIRTTGNSQISLNVIQQQTTYPYNFEFTFNTGENTSLWFSFNGYNAVNDTSSLETIFDNVQIEQGSTATDYEPYTGGQASPSPDYPQEIYSVGDDGSASVIVGNKNLFDNIYEQGSISFSTAGVDSVNNKRIRSSFIQVNENTTYTISNNNSNIFKVALGFYKKDKSYDTKNKYNSGNWNGFPQTFTTPPGTKYIKMIFRNNTDTDISPTGDYEIQLEKGSTATPYKPYTAQTYTIPCQQPMRSIGDVRDKFVRVNGSWYERHYIRHLELAIADMNNSENYPGWKNVPNIKTDYPDKQNRFKNYAYFSCNIALANSDLIYINTKTTNSLLYLDRTVLDLSQTEWKTNYLDLVLNLDYAHSSLAPTDLACTTAQTEILEQIYNEAKTYEGGTHIYSPDETSPYFEIEYFKNTNAILSNINNRLSLLE